MAAFEAVSRITLPTLNEDEVIDVRHATLPPERALLNDYNPADHRNPRNPIKLWMAHFNLLRTFFGAGILGLPLAVSQAGIILGPIMTMSLGLLIMHMHATLLWCLNDICRQLKIPNISYRYGFRIALLHGPSFCRKIGRYGPTIIAIFMLLSQLGICTVFVIFTTDSLRDIMDWPTSRPAMAVLFVPYLFLEYFMKTLKVISYISMMGTLFNFVGLIFVIYHIFLAPHGVLIYAAKNYLNFFFVIGTCLFNLSAVGVVLSLDKALKDPTVLTKPFGVIRFEMVIVTIILTIFGALGYWAFGTMEENVLRSLPFDDDTAMVAIGIYLVSIAFAYPIQCYPAIQIVIEIIKNRDVPDPPSNTTLKKIEYIARPIFVLATFIVCYFIPIQGAFVAFVGNLCTTLIALVFPALMEACILYPNHFGKYKIYLIKDIIIITFGLTAWLLGVALCGDLIYIRILTINAINNYMEY
nr:proton-coupled amino acid transporter-like protein CG1139 isoform X2 [Danaus plexippus plexippus]